MKAKKEKKITKGAEASAVEGNGELSNKSEVKGFLISLRDRMTDGSLAPIFVMGALNRIMNRSSVYEMLDNENREIARDLWLRLRQSGMQACIPTMLFSSEEVTEMNSAR